MTYVTAVTTSGVLPAAQSSQQEADVFLSLSSLYRVYFNFPFNFKEVPLRPRD